MKYCTLCKTKFEDNVSFCPTDGEVLEDDPSSIVGSVLDNQYQIESLLGKGGMGAVYLARHILLGDRVAIKILPPEVRNNPDWLRRFRREGQAARRLRHANAVAVHDLRTASDGTIYMVMEYVEGHTLDAELKKRGRFTPAEAFEVLEPIMSVLNTAHSMGVVHRDLKPENIMIGKAGHGEPVVKLLDLGIAKMREIAGVESSGTTELTMAGQMLGTPYYMSPEQWGEPSRDGSFEIDGRADIYSLGLVAYQMISGKRPYSAATLSELRREHITVTPPRLSEQVAGVSSAVSEVIERAISKDRDDRQPSAGELANQLRQALSDIPTTTDAERMLTQAPHADVSTANTLVTPQASNTQSDLNAPTIVTFEAIPTTAPTAPQPVSPQSGYGQASVAIEPALPPKADAKVDLSSSVTIQRAPKAQVGLAVPKKTSGKTLIFVGAGVLVLLLLVVAVGGFFALGWMKAKPDDTSSRGTTGSSATEALPATIELGRYWLEIDTQTKSEAIRAADLVTMKSGQSFKFHFVPLHEGYLYIIGPVEENALAAFLTAKPNSQSGLTTNEVKNGQDFTFPADTFKDSHWLTLDTKPGTETYTLIFSAEPLAEPAFLNSEATGDPLSDTEKAELNAFLAKYKTGEVVTKTDANNAAAPFVTLKVSQAQATVSPSAPLIFEVRIQHQ